jgi:hypothetical protein
MCLGLLEGSRCELNAIIEHELLHAEKAILRFCQNKPRDRGIEEKAGYTKQCEVYSSQCCLKDPDSTQFVTDCVNRLYGFSTNPEVVIAIKAFCDTKTNK